MDPTIPQPCLNPRQNELLTRLYTHRLDMLSLAAHEQLSAYELESFLTSAAVKSHLSSLESFLQSTLTLRTLAARFAILNHLEQAAKTTSNPTEKRLAATALLRAISPTRGINGEPVARYTTETASSPIASSPAPIPIADQSLITPEIDPPDPNTTLSRAYRAAAAAVRSSSQQTPGLNPPQSSTTTAAPQAESLTVSSRASTHSASPPEFASISRTPAGCSSYLSTQPSTQHARRPLDIASRAGLAPITTLEPLARPP